MMDFHFLITFSSTFQVRWAIVSAGISLSDDAQTLLAYDFLGEMR